MLLHAFYMFEAIELGNREISVSQKQQHSFMMMDKLLKSHATLKQQICFSKLLWTLNEFKELVAAQSK